MGKITKGILGGFSGRVGTVVGSSIFGIDIMRSYQPNVQNPRSPGQLTQRNKFSIIVKYLRQFITIIKIGFALKAIKQSAFNACVSYNVKNAITGTYPDQTIDHSKILIAQGPRAAAVNPQMDESSSSELVLTTEQNFVPADPEYNDLAYGLFFNITKERFHTSLGTKKRLDWGITEAIDNGWEAGDVVHGWIFFTSPDGSQISDSAYAGSTTLI